MTSHQTITYSCGHTREIVTAADADRHARAQKSWFGPSKPCFGCTHRDFGHRHERRDYFLSTFGELPPLAGTLRQIEWAEKIREGALVDTEGWLPSRVKEPEMQSAVRAHLLARTHAGWWIDRRDLHPHHLIQQAVVAIKSPPPHPRSRR